MLTAPDWNSLLDTALIYDQLMKTGDLRFMGELRLREAQFGATPADRARLNVDVGPTIDASLNAAGKDATVSRIDERRVSRAADLDANGMSITRRDRVIRGGDDG